MANLILHWEAAAPGVRELYESLSTALRGGDFYLAGGTALALLEGHRVSIDLDLFAARVNDPEMLAARLQGVDEDLVVTSVAPQTLYLRITGIQVSFLGVSCELLQPPIDPGEGLIPLASGDDIAAMKLAAIASRGSRKDFVDLWVLVSRRASLHHYLECYRAKYRSHDIGHVVRSLVYFDDADQEPPLRLLTDAPWERVKADFKTWVGALLNGGFAARSEE